MERPPEIQINIFQLNILLDDKQKDDYNYLLNNGVFCSRCGDICTKGIIVKVIYLTPLNDIMVQGTCKECGGKLTRIIEFGEDKDFYEKANDFRKLIRNS